MSPKVSIITATRNAMAHLPALADAILRHPPGLLEWIVIDCVSCDGTVEFLKGLRDPRLRWVSEPDSGIYDAWNKGVDLAEGQWLMFLGADDLPGPGWVEACAAAPEVDLVYGDFKILDAGGAPLCTIAARPWSEVSRNMKRRMVLPHPGLAHARRLFSTRRFEPSFRIAGDFQFLAGAEPCTAERKPSIQAIVKLGGVSNRPDRVELAYREYLRVLREQGQSMAPADRANWALKRACAKVAPSLYLSLQERRWRMKRFRP